MQEMMEICWINRKIENRTELSQFNSVPNSNRFSLVLQKSAKIKPNRRMLTPTRCGRPIKSLGLLPFDPGSKFVVGILSTKEEINERVDLLPTTR